MIARRPALASALVVGVVSLAACGGMSSSSSSSSAPPPRPAAMAQSMSMTVPITAAQQVPPTPSMGSGTGKVELEGTVLRWTVTYSGLTGPVTAAHFHGPAAPGANAGVVLPFTGPLTSPINGTANLTQAQIDQLKGGLWYINLHTAAHPGGEIRGQVR